MSRAQELLPIARESEPLIYDGMELTDEHRAALDITERRVPGPPGGPDVRVIVYRPTTAATRPVIVSIHGGAFVRFHADSFAAIDAAWSMKLDCVVVSVDYRLAPEHRFPAAPEDCYAVLQWVVANCDELAVDASRVVVAGGSAGGALTAAVTLMARDRGGPSIAYQGLMIPVLDDRLDTPSMRQGVDNPGFNSRNAEGMWLHYLGEDYDRSQTSPYAAPARAADLSGLPPAFVQTNGLDPLRDEGITYAQRLLAAGVPVELYNVPGAYHGAPAQNPAAALRAGRVYLEALAGALHPPR